MPADLYDQLTRAAASFGDAGEPDVALAFRRGRALRRRRGITTLAVAALVLGTVSGALVLTGGGGGGPVRVASSPDIPSGWPTVHSDHYDVSWQVPPDWQSSTTKLTTNLVDPAGALAAATFPLQPDAGACLTPEVARNMAPTDVYVALFVWLHQDGGGFPVRPAQFGRGQGQGDLLPCVRVTQGSAEMFDFGDHGLQLSALVITGNQATPERQTEVYAVLDSIRVGAGTTEPLTTTATTVTSSVPDSTAAGTPLTSSVPANLSGATPSTTSYPAGSTEAEVVTAFLGWTDTMPLDAKAPYVQDFDQIRASMEQASAQRPAGLDSLHGVVESVTVVDPTHAHVVYAFVNGDQTIVSGLPGDLVKIGGRWRVTKETVCAGFALASVRCP
jgi:hypothetical protein